MKVSVSLGLINNTIPPPAPLRLTSPFPGFLCNSAMESVGRFLFRSCSSFSLKIPSSIDSDLLSCNAFFSFSVSATLRITASKLRESFFCSIFVTGPIKR